MPFEAQELKKFTDSGRAIAKAAGVAVEQWAEGEMGVVLKMWAARTNVITPGKATIEARTSAGKKAFGATKASRSQYGVIVNSGRRDGEPGLLWYRTSNRKYQVGGKIDGDSTFRPQQASFKSGKSGFVHFANDVWAKIEAGGMRYAAELARLKPAAAKAIGLARQSVIQSADVLGIALEAVKGGANLSSGAIAKAREAIATNGNRYQNGTGNVQRTQGAFSIEAVNSYPLNRALRMDMSLQAAIQSRTAYFERNLANGVFKELKKVERAYPYLKIAA